MGSLGEGQEGGEDTQGLLLGEDITQGGKRRQVALTVFNGAPDSTWLLSDETLQNHTPSHTGPDMSVFQNPSGKGRYRDAQRKSVKASVGRP